MKRLQLGRLAARVMQFLHEDVWDVEIASLTRMRAAGVKAVRVASMVIRGYRRDECPLYASSLTFSTLMAIVPIMAFSLAVARGLGGDEAAKARIRGAVAQWTEQFGTSAAGTNAPALAGPPPADGGSGEVRPQFLAEQINNLVEQAFAKVENISFAGLGAVGLVLLLWMVISVLGRVEDAFNRVWGVTVTRSLWRKITDYLSVLFILPLLAMAASSLPVADFAARYVPEPWASKLAGLLASGLLKRLTVAAMTTLCFAFMIVSVPNTRVTKRAGLVGGLLTALLFIVWLNICAALQVGADRMGRIYGSFAVVPILITWVYMSWQIILFGAEVAFAVQNCATYRMESGARSASVRARILLSLAVVAEAGRAMQGRIPAFDLAAFAALRRVPVRLLNSVADQLAQAGFLGELTEPRGRYVLLKEPGTVHVSEIVDAVMSGGLEPAKVGLATVDPLIEEMVRKAERGIGDSLGRTTVEDLLRKVS